LLVLGGPVSTAVVSLGLPPAAASRRAPGLTALIPQRPHLLTDRGLRPAPVSIAVFGRRGKRVGRRPFGAGADERRESEGIFTQRRCVLARVAVCRFGRRAASHRGAARWLSGAQSEISLVKRPALQMGRSTVCLCRKRKGGM